MFKIHKDPRLNRETVHKWNALLFLLNIEEIIETSSAKIIGVMFLPLALLALFLDISLPRFIPFLSLTALIFILGTYLFPENKNKNSQLTAIVVLAEFFYLLPILIPSGLISDIAILPMVVFCSSIIFISGLSLIIVRYFLQIKFSPYQA